MALVDLEKTPSSTNNSATGSESDSVSSQNDAVPAAKSGSDSDSSDSDTPIGKSMKVTAATAAGWMMRKPLPSAVAVRRPRSAAAGKRPPADDDNNERRRARKKVILPASVVFSSVVNGGNDEDPKQQQQQQQQQQLFQRLWSEGDEIVILKGITDFVARNGDGPINELDSFHELIKSSLHIDVTRTQLLHKMRRLKKKFENNVNKGKRSFSNAHEQKAFDLSKSIWGLDGKLLGVDSSKANGSARRKRAGKAVVLPAAKMETPATPEVTLAEIPAKVMTTATRLAGVGTRKMGSLGESVMEDEFMRDGMELMDEAKKAALETKWKKLRLDEAEMYLKRVELVREQTLLVVEALRSAAN